MHRSIPAGTRAARSPVADLRLGSGEGTAHGSAAVRRLQRGLRRAGYAPGPVDGRFGPLTAAAVERFQANHALRVDGIVGRVTRRAMRAAPTLAIGAGEASPHGSSVVARLQRLLKRAGFSPGPIDGRLGPRTEHAILAFQRARHLAVDGIAGTTTEAVLSHGQTRAHGRTRAHGHTRGRGQTQRASTRPAPPRGGRKAHHARPAPNRHSTEPHQQPSRSSRAAQSSAPVTPRLPILWILLGLGVLGLTAVVSSYHQRPIVARAAQLRHAVSAIGQPRRGTASIPAPEPRAPEPRAPDPAAGAPAAPEPAAPVPPAPEPPALVFVIEEDNGGGYYWSILTQAGQTLARSARFSSYEDAAQAASVVHRAAASASVDDRTGGGRR